MKNHDVAWAVRLLPIWAAKSGKRVQSAVSDVLEELESRAGIVMSLSEEVQQWRSKADAAAHATAKGKTEAPARSSAFLRAGGNDCTCDDCKPKNAMLRSYASACIDEAVTPALEYIDEVLTRAAQPEEQFRVRHLRKLLIERPGT